jgi:hypothetical protein
MSSVRQYIDVTTSMTNTKFNDITTCREITDFKNIQKYKEKITKHMNRCGHGGHTDICKGYGKLKEYMCNKLLVLSNNNCSSLTYLSNGECYLHNEYNNDYWEGECQHSSSYHGYIQETFIP